MTQKTNTPLPSFKDYRKSIVEDYSSHKSKEEEREFGNDSKLHQGTHKFDQWNFEAGLHGPTRAKERQPNWSSDDWNKLLSDSHAAITDTSKHIVPKGQTSGKVGMGAALFYSLSRKQGVLMRISPKDKNNTKLGGETRLQTIPPYKASKVDAGTRRIVIEDVEYEIGKNLFLIE